MNPVSTADLQVRLMRPLTPGEEAGARALLDDAWAELVHRVPSVPGRLDAGDLSRDLVVRVETAMVLRVLRNPDGLRQVSIDDYMQIRDQVVSAGVLQVLPDELRLMQPSAGRSGSVRLVAHGDV